MMELITGHSGSNHISGVDISKINSAVYSANNYVLKTSFLYDEVINDGQIKISAAGDCVALFSGRMVLIKRGDSVTVNLPDSGTLYKKIIIGIHYIYDTTTQIESCEMMAVEGGPYSSVATANSAILGSYPGEISAEAQTTHAFMPLNELIVSGLSVHSRTARFNLLPCLEETQSKHATDKAATEGEILKLRTALNTETTTRGTEDKKLDARIDEANTSIAALNTALTNTKLFSASISKSGGVTAISGSGVGYLLYLSYLGVRTSLYVPYSSELSSSSIGKVGVCVSLPSVVIDSKIYLPKVNVYYSDAKLNIRPFECKYLAKSIAMWDLSDDTDISVNVEDAYLIQPGAIK